MTFKEWLGYFKEVDLPIGDLARDVYNDDNFPDSNDPDVLHDYLLSTVAIDTFEDAFCYYCLTVYPTQEPKLLEIWKRLRVKDGNLIDLWKR
jgi:uncharacterized protein YozE (UPF0346 family)